MQDPAIQRVSFASGVHVVRVKLFRRRIATAECKTGTPHAGFKSRKIGLKLTDGRCVHARYDTSGW
jgi:hypothetical protein